MNPNDSGLPLPGPAANDPGAAKLVMPGRTLSASDGVEWVASGWRLFRKAILMWIVFLVLFVLIHLALGMVPWIGGLLGSLLSPILLGGIALGCRSLENGGELELEHFLAGFRRNTGMLLAIGVVYVLGEILLLCVFAMFVGWSVIVAMLTGGGSAAVSAVTGSLVGVALGGLVVAALAIPLMAAYWFAPALAMLHDVPALPAMKESLFASLRNWVPFLVYGLLMMVLAIAAAIPLGLGLLVWLPLLITSSYASYRAVFTERDAPAS